jgi:hypothetical protein
MAERFMSAELEITWNKWPWSNRSTAPTFYEGIEQQNYAKPQDRIRLFSVSLAFLVLFALET